MKASFHRFISLLRHYLTFWHLKRVFVFFLVDVLLMSFVRRGKSDCVLILKYDQLGDYIIVRNFLRAIRKHPPYKSKKLVLCGNIALRDLVEIYDLDIFDEFIWVDRSDLLDGVTARFKILSQVKRLGPQIAIHPMFGLESYAGDCLMRAAGAPQRFDRSICFDPKTAEDEAGKTVYYGPFLQQRQILFDFVRNKLLFTAALPGVELPETTRLDPIPVPLPKFNEPFAILMPGASDAFREWSPERFAQVARHLSDARGLNIFILGTKSDSPKALAIQKAEPTVVIKDLCGHLTLPQVVCLMDRCTVGVTNDSGGIHLLAALNKPGVAISNGFSLRFFHPYPKDISKSVSFVYPPALYAISDSKERIELVHGQGKYFPIADVQVEKVVERIETLLQRRPFHDPMQDVHG